MIENTREYNPRLKFHKFKNISWKKGILSNFISIVTPKYKIQTDNYLQYGNIPIIDQSKKYISGYTNDIKYIISNITPLIIFGDHTCIIKIVHFKFAQGADGIKIFYGNKNISTEYIYQYLNHSPVIMEEYKRHFSILKDKVIYYPDDRQEQQKIAACLSSLDELIEAHEQKLDTLQQYKKGLMQRLFPAEGKTIPHWRFPEFRNNGEWKNISVSQLGKIITGKTPSTSNLSFWNGEYIWVTPTDITSHKYIYSSNRTVTSLWIKNNILPVNTVLITCIASIGKNCILRKEGFCNQQINAIVPNLKNYDSSFIYYNFEKNEHILINNSGASATRILPKSKFEELHFLFPSLPEQQKIANCLTSLDERIEAQEEKITALKEHKKGLMQQLFPSL